MNNRIVLTTMFHLFAFYYLSTDYYGSFKNENGQVFPQIKRTVEGVHLVQNALLLLRYVYVF